MIRKALLSRAGTGLTVGALAAVALLAPGAALADDVSPGLFTANNVWMMMAAALVFVMHLGFAMVESGLTRAKNTTNILFKNTFIIMSSSRQRFFSHFTQFIFVKALLIRRFVPHV